MESKTKRYQDIGSQIFVRDTQTGKLVYKDAKRRKQTSFRVNAQIARYGRPLGY